jgi:ubiquinone/menaquinone biosynthesis C-methylase UbiE
MPSPIQTVTTESYPQWARKGRTPASMEEYLRGWEEFFDHYASIVHVWRNRNSKYHQSLLSLARFYIPENQRVLELGSGTGDLLFGTRPRRGLGIDISGEMVRLASQRFPDLEFRQQAAELLDLGEEKFDYVILSDLTGFLFDIRLVFQKIRKVCHPETRIVINWFSRLWQPFFSAAEKLGLKYPQPLLNWTTVEDIVNLLGLADVEMVHHRANILLPFRLPVLASFANRYLAHCRFSAGSA